MKFDPLREPVREYSVDPSRLLEGDPRVSSAVVWGSPEEGVWGGIWEMTEGTLDDVDVDEVAYVVCGRATVSFADTGESMELTAGDLVVFTPGQKSRWQVHERLRAIMAARR